MASAPTQAAERVLGLKPGKCCVLNSLGPLLTARKYLPEAKFTTRKVDGQYVVQRTA